MDIRGVDHNRDLTAVDRAIVIAVVGLFLALALLAVGGPVEPENPTTSVSGILQPVPVAAPAGFVQIKLPPHSCALASTPFVPTITSLNAVFAGQLTASSDRDLVHADRILVWDSATSRYRTAAKLILPASSSSGSGTDDGSVWFEISVSPSGEETILGPADATFRVEPGSGFILCNLQSFPQTVRISGAVVMSSSMPVVIPRGINPTAYPFTSAKDVNETQWSKSAPLLSATTAFEFGVAYWTFSATNALWQEPRPYPNPFSSSNAPVHIADIVVDDDKATLDIAIPSNVFADGAEAPANGAVNAVPPKQEVQSIDIFALDLAVTDAVTDFATGWKLAASNIAVTGRTELHWSDDLSSSASTFKGVRLYLVTRADSAADLNGDGVPDPRDRFTRPSVPSTPANAPTPPSLLLTSSAGMDTTVSTTGAGVGGTTGLTAAPGNFHGFVFVSLRNGSDSYSGLLNTVTGNDGPKKTICEGTKTADLKAKDTGSSTMVIRDGVYNEDLRISRKPIRVRIQGKVTLRDTPKRDAP